MSRPLTQRHSPPSHRALELCSQGACRPLFLGERMGDGGPVGPQPRPLPGPRLQAPLLLPLAPPPPHVCRAWCSPGVCTPSPEAPSGGYTCPLAAGTATPLPHPARTLPHPTQTLPPRGGRLTPLLGSWSWTRGARVARSRLGLQLSGTDPRAAGTGSRVIGGMAGGCVCSHRLVPGPTRSRCGDQAQHIPEGAPLTPGAGAIGGPALGPACAAQTQLPTWPLQSSWSLTAVCDQPEPCCLAMRPPPPPPVCSTLAPIPEA